MTNELVQAFFAQTYTLSQARSRLRLLRAYLIGYFYQNEKQKQKDSWLASLGENFYKQFSRDNVYQKLRTLEDTINATEPLILYITFDMPEDEVNKLGVWIRANIKSGLVFDTKIDQHLIAGAAISWKGRYRDFSLKARIEDRRERILKILKTK